jgi:hypothetical protein
MNTATYNYGVNSTPENEGPGSASGPPPIAESKLAYEFAANSYSFSARAERALDVLRDALEADERRKEHIEVSNQQMRMDNDLQYDLTE